MSKIRIKNVIKKAVLVLLLFWGSASFFLFVSHDLVKLLILVLSLLSLYFIFSSSGEFILLLFLNFINLYAFYGLLFTYNLPLYLVMIGLVLMSGSTFYILGRKMISSSNFNLYILFFIILILEIYLTLSYWLINPLTRSFIVAIFIYLFYGFITSTESQKFENKSFTSYIYITIIVLLVLIFTISWGH